MRSLRDESRSLITENDGFWCFELECVSVAERSSSLRDVMRSLVAENDDFSYFGMECDRLLLGMTILPALRWSAIAFWWFGLECEACAT
ncbi:hypothetical protein [Calothrix sp. PCC 6303]|uniref:hypothetical protein n=1 Tax=Calothrix sp. PCC 6303 TaxID=1170562 RepID=UPI0005A15D2E|nr:hypothetical protein [Calothrix sp. PCC 6303]